MRNRVSCLLIMCATFLLLLLAGCGGGGGGATTTTGAPANANANALTSVSWYFENNAPDYNNGTTCSMIATLSYDPAIASSDIVNFNVTAPNGARWTSAASSSQFGTNSSGIPYISRRLVYGDNKQSFPLAGTWTFQLVLKDGTTSSIQRTLHEPGSRADAAHPYLYTAGDWTPSTNGSDYVASLRRLPSEGYTVQYSPANGGRITTQGLAAAREAYLAAEPRAYNMYCWLYDANNNYLGRSYPQYSQLDHSNTGVITTDGELLLLPATTIASIGTVDLSQVKYIRFVYMDGAQYAPASYSSIDYHSVSSVVAVQSTRSLLGGTMQNTPLSLGNIVTTFVGSPLLHGSADGTGAVATFNTPNGITTDGTNLFVADNINHTIRVIAINSGRVRTIAGSAGSPGSADGIGTAARFHDPLGITTDGSNLYVTDYNNHTIRKIVIATGAVTTLAGSAGNSGSADGIAAARFNGPSAITTDGTNLYVADTFNNTIKKIVIATGAVTTIAGTAGMQDSADGVGSAASFYWPSGITTDGSYLYVTDRGNRTIRKIELATGAVSTVAGAAGISGSADGTGAAASFKNPMGITSDGTSLYVTDFIDNTIRKIAVSTWTVTTIAGAAGSTGSADGAGHAATFYWPTDITTDGKSLFVVDSQNNTIRRIY